MNDELIRDIRPAGLTRRDALRWSLAGVGLMALGPAARLLPTAMGAPQPLKRMVVMNCFGGNDTLNMFVPTTLSPYYTRRTGLALLESECLPLQGTSAYRMHPAMPKIAALWNDGEVAAVNRVGYPKANLSHFESMDIMSFGVRNGFAPLGMPQSGWLARFCDEYAPTPLGAVAVNVGRPRDIVGGATTPLPVSRLSSFKILGAGAGGGSYTPAHYHRLAAAKEIISSFSGTGRTAAQKTALSQAHDLTTQVQSAVTNFTTPVTYPAGNRLGDQMKDIAILIQGGFETRIFYTGFGGFDTHSAQGTAAGAQATLFQRMDDAVGAFVDDMKAMNVWNDMVIVIVTEFGRRNYVNGSLGTDHGHAFTALVLGGRVRGGVYGPLLTEADINAEYPSYAVDFRSIYKEVLDRHMNLNPNPVFPEPLAIENTLGLI